MVNLLPAGRSSGLASGPRPVPDTPAAPPAPAAEPLLSPTPRPDDVVLSPQAERAATAPVDAPDAPTPPPAPPKPPLVGLTLFTDAESGRTVAIRRDKDSGEVIEQIPEERLRQIYVRQRQDSEAVTERLALDV